MYTFVDYRQCDKLTDTQYLCYNNLADLYRRHQGYERSHKYYTLSFKCAEKLRDKDKQVHLHGLRALVCKI